LRHGGQRQGQHARRRNRADPLELGDGRCRECDDEHPDPSGGREQMDALDDDPDRRVRARRGVSAKHIGSHDGERGGGDEGPFPRSQSHDAEDAAQRDCDP
jgi:hypothetical protein